MVNVSQGCTQADIPTTLKYLDKKETIRDGFDIVEQQSSVESLFLHEFWEDYNMPKFELSFMTKKTNKSMNRTTTNAFGKFGGNEDKSIASPSNSPKRKGRDSVKKESKKVENSEKVSALKESKISLKQPTDKSQLGKNLARFEERKRMQLDEIKIKLK